MSTIDILLVSFGPIAIGYGFYQLSKKHFVCFGKTFTGEFAGFLSIMLIVAGVCAIFKGINW